TRARQSAMKSHLPSFVVNEGAPVGSLAPGQVRPGKATVVLLLVVTLLLPPVAAVMPAGCTSLDAGAEGPQITESIQWCTDIPDDSDDPEKDRLADDLARRVPSVVLSSYQTAPVRNEVAVQSLVGRQALYCNWRL